MKKTMAFLLAALLVWSCLPLVACDKTPEVKTTGISVKDGTLPASVEQNAKIDYSSVKIIVKYSDGTTKELSVKAFGVSYREADTSKVGQAVFTVEYAGLKASANITVYERIVEAEVQSIYIKESTLPKVIKQGSKIDYASVVLVVVFSDGKESEIPVTANGVKYDAIDTSVAGKVIFKVTYAKKEATAEVTIEEIYSVTEFSNTDGYKMYEVNKAEQSNKENEFYVKDVPYTVGSVNGYVCNPKVIAVDIMSGGDKEIELKNVKTDYELFEYDSATALSGDALTKYLSKVENNVYYFTSEANDKLFRLRITLSDEYETILDTPYIEQTIKVVDGYNVYDANGLSVLDNLNNVAWAEMKDTKLDWDEHKLSGYADIKQVILHDEIIVKKSDLPAKYFWAEGDEAVGGGRSYADALSRLPENMRHLLAGSLKETNWGETYNIDGGQRGLYASNGIGLNGNYMQVSYEDGLVVDDKGDVTAPNGGIYVAWDFNDMAKETDYAKPHVSFVAYKNVDEQNAKGNRIVQNVLFVGRTGKTDNTNLPAAIMMFHSALTENKATLDNIVANSWFANVELNNRTTLDITNCKFYSSFSQMVYGYYAKEINVVNCEMKRSGGPLFILQSATDNMGEDRIANESTVLNIDSTANMESWLSGREAWFAINTKEAMPVVNQLMTLTKIVDNTAGTNFFRMDGELAKSNVIAVIIPSPGDAFTNQYTLNGKINVGTNSYGMDDATFNAIIANKSNPAAAVAPVFKLGAVDVSTLGQNINYGFIATMPTNETIGTMKLNNPMQEAVAAAIIPMIKQNPTQFGLPADATDEQINAAAPTIAQSLWENSMKSNHTGEFALYVSPGALGETPNTSIKHFLMLFGGLVSTSSAN